MPDFTDAQKRCIDCGTGDVLVSAGAGSGKTTVLAERIMRRLENGADIKDFLVVTFTNAAAADLKAKLAERLEALSLSAPENRAYRRMLYSLDCADICTIDSFCLQYVKQNAAVLGLTEGVSTGDEALCDSLKAAALDEVLTKLCEDDEPTADLLLDNFAGHKSDDALLEAVTELYNKLRAYPFYLEWLDETVRSHAGEEAALRDKGFFACRTGLRIKAAVEERLGSLEECVSTLYAESADQKQYELAKRLDDKTSALKAALEKGYDEFCHATAPEKLKRPNGCPEEYVRSYEEWKSAFKGLSAYVRPKERLCGEYRLEGEVLAALYRAVVRLDEAYAAAKRERGVLDFPDAEHFMLRLLVAGDRGGLVKTDLCRSISASYREIFVDEYQDVSPLQDAIFSALGAGKRFMVGDVKQSIYGFRNAYPDIFTSYSKDFAAAERDGAAARILLRENFRCDKNIIDFCNGVFDRVFTEKSAGTDYKAERLVFGKNSAGGAPVRLTLYENADLEAEATGTAEEIVRLLRSGAQAKDVAVLTRKADDLNVFARALAARGVPCFTLKSKKPLLKQPETLLALSLLRVIDDPTDDVSLAAVLRSPIYRFTADELVSLRRDGSLYDDVRAAVKEADRFVRARFRLAGGGAVRKPKKKPLLIKRVRPPLAEKCAAFVEKLRLYRTKALFTPVNELLWYLYGDTKLLLYAPEGGEKQYKDDLFALLALAGSFENGVYKGVSGFVEYVDGLEKANRSPDAPTAPEDDAVSLMTVHASKGLEFPTVFVCGCGGRLLKAKRTAVSVNYRLGVSVKLSRQAKAWKTSTLARDAALRAEDARIIAEEYRILYVAFTRAKERLYISAAVKGGAEAYLAKRPAEPTVYADLFFAAAADVKGECLVFDTVDAAQTEIPVTRLDAAAADDEADEDLPPELDDETAAPERVTAKYSVSALTRLENGLLGVPKEARVDDKTPVFANGGGAGGAERGTANHLFLQFADFAAAEKDVRAEAERLLDLGFIDKEQFSLLNLPSLGRFFRSKLYGKIKASPRVYREKRFTTRVSSALFNENKAESVLLQGVIDCFFENADGLYTLVDYKTDYAKEGDEPALAEKHGTQLLLYAEYIKKLTGKPVSEAYVYSLSLNKAIPINRTE